MTSTPDYGQCEYDRIGIGRCKETATHLYVRPGSPDARVCRHHKMGDGKAGRRDFGWIEVIQDKWHVDDDERPDIDSMGLQ
jgi:hypothetical protein